MDLHPLFVHFPIALLTLYSALEVVRRFTKASYWMPLRAVLVVVGTLAAFVTLSTGEGAEELFKENEFRDVLELHSLLATVTTWLYAILAISYLLLWMARHTSFLQLLPKALERPAALLLRIASFIVDTPIAIVLAILGFLGLLLVGSLGAILVYGPAFDPVTSLVYKVLFGG